MSKLLVAYIRISTEKQQIARNGAEAQREEIERFAQANGYTIVEFFEEAVSGKYGLDYRPQLKKAIELCEKKKATLVCSKLDRLSRKASFIMNLMDTNLKFVIAELGENITPFMLHIYCVISEAERAAIGARTKAALAAKKKREPEWKPGHNSDMTEAREKGRTTLKRMANIYAEEMRPIIESMVTCGHSLNKIATILNSRNYKTQRGKNWTAKSVSNLQQRWKASPVYVS
jgi:DNA invertase Pin-like site-specific DNA recombinase